MSLKQVNLRKVESSIIKEAKKTLFNKLVNYNGKLTQIAKESVQDLEAIDTGLMQSRTIHQILPTSPAQIVNKLVVSYQTRNIDYAKYVYFGLGTSKKYGARKFNLVSAEKTKQLLETGSYTRQFSKGGSSQSNDLAGGLNRYRKNLRKKNEIKKLGIGSLIKGTRGNVRKGVLKSARANYKKSKK